MMTIHSSPFAVYTKRLFVALALTASLQACMQGSQGPAEQQVPAPGPANPSGSGPSQSGQVAQPRQTNEQAAKDAPNVTVSGAALPVGNGSNVVDASNIPSTNNSPSTSSTPEAAAPTATVPITLSQQSLKDYGLDTNNLSYHFHYLTVDITKPITFANGTTTLTIPGLPSGQAGDLTLEVLQGGVVKMRGAVPNVLLIPGASSLPLKLSPVSGGGTGSLTVNATVDPSATTQAATTQAATNQPASGGSNQVVGNNPPTKQPGGTATIPATTTTTTAASTSAGIPTATIPTTTTTATNQPANPQNAGFARDVKPIFDRACAECHHPGGRSPDLSQPPTSAGVDQILSVAGGSSPAMPPAPRDPLSQDDLNAISAWRNAGLNP